MKQSRAYKVNCPECGPKGVGVVSGNDLPDTLHMFVLDCWCVLTAVELTSDRSYSEPLYPRQSKTAQRHAAMLERCLGGPDARKEMP